MQITTKPWESTDLTLHINTQTLSYTFRLAILKHISYTFRLVQHMLHSNISNMWLMAKNAQHATKLPFHTFLAELKCTSQCGPLSSQNCKPCHARLTSLQPFQATPSTPQPQTTHTCTTCPQGCTQRICISGTYICTPPAATCRAGVAFMSRGWTWPATKKKAGALWNQTSPSLARQARTMKCSAGASLRQEHVCLPAEQNIQPPQQGGLLGPGFALLQCGAAWRSCFDQKTPVPTTRYNGCASLVVAS